MSCTWLNSIKAVKVGTTNRFIIVYRTGQMNDTEKGYTTLKGLDHKQVVFTYEEAKNCIKQRFGNAKGILKEKRRNSEFYKAGELEQAFMRALHKKEKFNIIETLTPYELRKNWIHYCAITETEWDQETRSLISSQYTRFNKENWEETVDKLINSKNARFKFTIMRKKY